MSLYSIPLYLTRQVTFIEQNMSTSAVKYFSKEVSAGGFGRISVGREKRGWYFGVVVALVTCYFCMHESTRVLWIWPTLKEVTRKEVTPFPTGFFDFEPNWKFVSLLTVLASFQRKFILTSIWNTGLKYNYYIKIGWFLKNKLLFLL